MGGLTVKIVDRIALILVIIGALNWGSIGLFRFDCVAAIFGGQLAVWSRIISIHWWASPDCGASPCCSGRMMSNNRKKPLRDAHAAVFYVLFRSRRLLLRRPFRLGLRQHLSVMLGGKTGFIEPGKEVRPPGHSAFIALFFPPVVHLPMMSR